MQHETLDGILEQEKNIKEKSSKIQVEYRV